MPTFGMPSHIDFSVSDAESSAEWYARVLGLKRARRANLGNRIMIVLVHQATGLLIGLNQHSEVPVNRFDDRSVGLDHVGFSVAERAELDARQKQHWSSATRTTSSSNSGGLGNAEAAHFRLQLPTAHWQHPDRRPRLSSWTTRWMARWSKPLQPIETPHYHSG